MENKEILENLEELIQATFSDPQRMRNFLTTQSKMYDMSYSNVLILKSQRENVSKIISKEVVENNGEVKVINENTNESINASLTLSPTALESLSTLITSPSVTLYCLPPV